MDATGPVTPRQPIEAVPPARPPDDTPESLGFTRMKATRWLNPDVVVASGLRHVLTSLFGSFLDKRELQETLGAEAHRHHADDDGLWFDYIADTGDGFDATYTMTSLLAQRELDVEGCPEPLPRGQLLVLGGDEVYPAATAENYEHRLSGPLRAALPWTVDDHPRLYALPGNHDWYDGLTGFLRLFGQHAWIGGWRTPQNRSYFAVELPHRWWLWGMDIQADQFVDEPQLRYFTKVLERCRPRDRVILATSDPSWIETERRADAFRNIAFVDHRLLRPRGIELRLAVAGNLHHYNRYTFDPGDTPGDNVVDDARGLPVDSHNGDVVPPAHLLTAGGGGAFLHPTHDLPHRLQVPVLPGRSDPTRAYRLAATYPRAKRSRRLAWSAALLPFRNLGFLWFGAGVHIVFLWTNQFGLRHLHRVSTTTYPRSAQHAGWRDLSMGLVRNPIAGITLMVMTVGLVLLVRRPPWARHEWVSWLVRVVLGVLHSAVQVAVLVLVGLLAITLASSVDTDRWFVALASVLAAGIGAVASAVVLGAYFAAANTTPRLRIHGNEAFSAARLARHRSFLRLHLDGEGHLHVYVLGVERSVHKWRADPDNPDPEAPWLVPDGPPPRTHLIERLLVE